MIGDNTVLSLNIKGRLHDWSRPVVMGIINLTPDSFYSGSRVRPDEVCSRAGEMLREGADILDLGAESTRPGATALTAENETEVLLPAVGALRDRYPEAIISIDTYRADVAAKCIEAGADIINDVSGGTMDPDMFDTVASLGVPYVLMHIRGTPATMQSLTDYDDICAEVLEWLARRADELHQKGVCDVIIDPGFGFAKTPGQNYMLLDSLRIFTEVGPVLAGMSRKSMLTKELGLTADKALNATTCVNMIALMNGAAILRVHDVAPAAECVRIHSACVRNRQSRRQLITTRYSDGTMNAQLYPSS